MLIAGAGGFAGEILELFLQSGIKEKIFFFDDIDDSKTSIGKYKVLKTAAEIKQLFAKHRSFCLGVGGVQNRVRLHRKMILLGGEPKTIISPHAHLGKINIEIGEAVFIGTRTIITTNVKIGMGCLINVNCTIMHDSSIGSFCELSPGVHISGNCTIGDHCSIGTGAVLLPGISIGQKVIVGAGAVVTKNVPPGSTVAGVPAKPLKKKTAKK